MAVIIKNIQIDGYRSLKNLSLNNLSDINIIAGDNNTGKTSILEILSNLGASITPNAWMMRAGRVNLERSAFSCLDSIFNIDDTNKEITVQVSQENKNTVIKLWQDENTERLSIDEMEKNEALLNEGPAIKRAQNHLEHSNHGLTLEEIRAFPQEYPVRYLETFLNGEKKSFNKIYPFQNAVYAGRDTLKKEKNRLIKTHYISPSQHTDVTLSLKNILNHAKKYTDMLKVLKAFDPDILNITAVENDDVYFPGVTYKIISQNHEEALPLEVYGYGMKKAILLMAAVVEAQNGLLLIDEFETAIHTSAMDTVFQWILKACIDLNVQLFLTSHSKEALEKILTCEPELQDNMRVITLVKREHGTKARMLTGREAVEVQNDYGLELR